MQAHPIAPVLTTRSRQNKCRRETEASQDSHALESGDNPSPGRLRGEAQPDSASRVFSKTAWLDEKIMHSSISKRHELRRSFKLHTVKGGFSNGRVYEFRCSSAEQRDMWISQIRSAVLAYNRTCERELYNTRWKRTQYRLRVVYEGHNAQVVVAVLITGNFLLNCVAFELLPEDGSSTAKLFDRLEVVFNFLFLAELLFNLAAHWLVDFFTNAWNVFGTLATCSSYWSCVCVCVCVRVCVCACM
jgi:hypothetical protein